MIYRYIQNPSYSRDADKGKSGKDYIPGDLFRETQLANTKEVEALNEGRGIQRNNKKSGRAGQCSLFD